MANLNNSSTFIHQCADYTFKNSIGVINKRAARVVSVASLKQYLISKNNYHYIQVHFKTLENFLKSVQEVVTTTTNQKNNCGDWGKHWGCEWLLVEDYRVDPRFRYHYFPELVNYKSENTMLFICYSGYNHSAYLKEISINAPVFSNKKLLSEELNSLYEELKPKQSMIDERRSLKNRIQAQLSQTWPNYNLNVIVFGSSANGLSLKDADLDLCIAVPEPQYEQDFRRYKNKLTRTNGSVYNMQCIAAVLTSMGMTDVEPICNATVPICKFTDPVTNLNCDINTNNVLGIENTRLIRQYIKMDARVEPFLFAIKYFTKQKDINNTMRGTLSSYAYIIMALYFLMVHYAGPVIPSLQCLPVECTSKKCNWKTARPILVFHDHKLMRCDVRFHTCTMIENTYTDEFTVAQDSTMTTVWKGSNFFMISTLLIEFFRYFSQVDNLQASIITGEKGFSSLIPKLRDRDIVVQDPFLTNKNVAQTCSIIGLGAIIDEFKRASDLLEHGFSFEYVCDRKYNLPRAIDRKTIEYKRKYVNSRSKVVAERGKKQIIVPTTSTSEVMDENKMLLSSNLVVNIPSVHVYTEEKKEISEKVNDPTMANKKESLVVKKESLIVKKDSPASKKESNAFKKESTSSKKESTAFKKESLVVKKETSVSSNKSTIAVNESPAFKVESSEVEIKKDVPSVLFGPESSMTLKQEVPERIVPTKKTFTFEPLISTPRLAENKTVTTAATAAPIKMNLKSKVNDVLKKTDRSFMEANDSSKGQEQKEETLTKLVKNLLEKRKHQQKVQVVDIIGMIESMGLTEDVLPDLNYVIHQLQITEFFLKKDKTKRQQELHKEEWLNNYSEQLINISNRNRLFSNQDEMEDLEFVEAFLDGVTDKEERVDIQLYVFNVPAGVEAYQIFSCLQWYGKIIQAEKVGESNGETNATTWKVHLNIQKKNIHCIQEQMDFGDFVSAIQII